MAVLMMISLQDLMSRFRNERILNMYGSFIGMRISELCIKKGVSEYMLYTLAKDLDAEDLQVLIDTAKRLGKNH